MRTRRWKRAVVGEVFFALLILSTGLFAEWQPVGSLRPLGRKGNEFTFGNDRATVVVAVLAPDLVRVRADRIARPSRGTAASW